MVALPTDQVHLPEEFVTGAAVAEMAAHAERVGVDAVFVTDHPAPDDRWLAGGGHHALEPTIALSFAAAHTTTLRLVTNIYVLAYRNPLLAAKTLASLDVLSGGRLTVGVAAGYLKSEFAALGVPFEDRGARLDRGIAAMVQAWSGQSVVHEDPGWSARGNTILPVPIQRPHPPIWCGGNSDAAMRRAVRLGSGWMPFATPPLVSSAVRTAEIASVADLGARLDRLDELCIEAGRTTAGRAARPTISFTPLAAWPDADSLLAEATASAELGVDWLALTIAPRSGVESTREEWMASVTALVAALEPVLR